jgi:hypothetical protein
MAITPARRTSMPVINAEPEAEIAAEERVPATNMVQLHFTADSFAVARSTVGPFGSTPALAQGRGGNFYRAHFFKMEELYVGSARGVVHFTMFPIRCSGTEQVYRRLVCKECVRVFKERLAADEHGFLWPPTFYRTQHPTAKIHFYNDLYCTAAANRDANGNRIIAEIQDCAQCVIDFTERVNLLFRAGDVPVVQSSEEDYPDPSVDENDSEA